MATNPENPPEDLNQNWLEVVRRQVESLRFGAVQIIVHDARVIQIETTERLRFGKGGRVAGPGSTKPEAGAKTVEPRKS